jgi:hypothetical protein
MTIWYILCSLGTYFRFWYYVPRKVWQPRAAALGGLKTLFSVKAAWRKILPFSGTELSIEEKTGSNPTVLIDVTTYNKASMYVAWWRFSNEKYFLPLWKNTLA